MVVVPSALFRVLKLHMTTLVSFLRDFLYLLLCGSGEPGPFGCIT